MFSNRGLEEMLEFAWQSGDDSHNRVVGEKTIFSPVIAINS
jgi:hypothetical protein